MLYNFIYRPLQNPSTRRYFEQGLNKIELLTPEIDGDCFLSIQSVHALHETVDLNAQCLKESWQENSVFINGQDDKVAPIACHPIYLITVGCDEDERIVYIGKTSSGNSRFKSGHKAISCLHHPKYEGMKKRLYRCGVVFLNNRNHVPIEFIQPFEIAESFLNSFEANLIYWTQPELNTQYTKTEPEFKYGQVHVQNITNETSFWNDKFI